MEPIDIVTVVCACTVDLMTKTAKSMIHLSYLSKILVDNAEIKKYLKENPKILKKGHWIKECLLKDPQKRFQCPPAIKIGSEQIFFDVPEKLETKGITIIEAVEFVFEEQKFLSRDIATLCFDVTKMFPHLRETYPQNFGDNLVKSLIKSPKFIIQDKMVNYIPDNDSDLSKICPPFYYLEKNALLPCSIKNSESSAEIKIDTSGFEIDNIISKKRALTFYVSQYLFDSKKDRVNHKSSYNFQNPPSVIKFVSPKGYSEIINFSVKGSLIKVTLKKET